MAVPTARSLARWWRRRQAARRRYERDVDAALRRLIRPGAVCVDAGAYRGVLTVLMARLAGRRGRVHAFEPEPVNADRLRRAVRRRGLASRVTVEEAALLDRNGEVELTQGRSDSEWSVDAQFAGRADRAPRQRARTLARCVTLDDYLSGRGLTVDVIKIDVEGAEGRVLEGMRRTLAISAPQIVLEYHGELGWPAIGVLREEGYEFFGLDGRSLGSLDSPADVPYHLLARKRGLRAQAARDR